MITFLCRTLTLPCVRGLKSIVNVLGSASRIHASEWSGNKMLIVVGNWHSGNYKYQNLLGLLQQFSSFHQQSSISLLSYVTKLYFAAWSLVDYILNHGYLRVALLLSSGSVRSYAHDMHSSSKYIQHLFTVSKRSRITFLHVVRIRF